MDSRRMKRFSFILGLGALLAFVATPSYSVQSVGSSEIQVSGGFFHAQDSNTSDLSADVSYGYYFFQPLEVGIRQGINYTFINNADNPWLATTTPFIDYYFFADRNFQPFVGGFGGIVWNDDDITGTIGPEGGIKYYVNDTTFLEARYRYEWFFNDFDVIEDEASDGNQVVTVGIGFVWGGR
ncbi:MAG TPA: hypothetical protein VLB01_00150 [Thermodesulfobacteriota bacterium]|nr:hypothetical protein [Thermodesulfobacteriota bacterium]